MADVKWIKIVTDIFDDEKVLLIEQMPEADTILVLWFKLLCLAGKSNTNGLLMLNDKIAYTDEMFCALFRRPLNTVRLAISTFEQFGMIEIIDNIVSVSNWEKHQNGDKLETIKKQTRTRVRNHRAKQKALVEAACNAECNVTVTLPVTPCNATDKEEDKEEDKELDREESTAAVPPTLAPSNPEKHKYGEYGWIRLTDTEHSRLLADLGLTELQRCIRYVDESAQSTGNKNKWKDWNLVLRRCSRQQWGVYKSDKQGSSFADVAGDW